MKKILLLSLFATFFVCIVSVSPSYAFSCESFFVVTDYNYKGEGESFGAPDFSSLTADTDRFYTKGQEVNCTGYVWAGPNSLNSMAFMPAVSYRVTESFTTAKAAARVCLSLLNKAVAKELAKYPEADLYPGWFKKCSLGRPATTGNQYFGHGVGVAAHSDGDDFELIKY